MTYLEKYKLEHPGLSSEQYLKHVIDTCPRGALGIPIFCPQDLRTPGMTNEARCPICWNREIPGTEPTNNTTNEREDGNMSKKFTKKDLKVGYVVKLRKGEIRMIMPGENGALVVINKDGTHSRLNDQFDDDLKMRGEFRAIPEIDIMEVYGFAKYDYMAVKFSTEDRDLLWKREPEKTCDSCAHKVVCTHVGMCEHYMEKEASK